MLARHRNPPLDELVVELRAEHGVGNNRTPVRQHLLGLGLTHVKRPARHPAEAARVAALGLRYRTSPGETQGARATPAQLPDAGGDAGAGTNDTFEQE